jgi:hypothetical protein
MATGLLELNTANMCFENTSRWITCIFQGFPLLGLFKVFHSIALDKVHIPDKESLSLI